MRGGHIFYLNHHLSYKSFTESYINYTSVTSNYGAFHKSLRLLKPSDPNGCQADAPEACRMTPGHPSTSHLSRDVTGAHHLLRQPSQAVPQLKQVCHPNGKSRGPICPRSFGLEIKISGLQYFLVYPCLPNLSSIHNLRELPTRTCPLARPENGPNLSNQLATTGTISTPSKDTFLETTHRFVCLSSFEAGITFQSIW